MDKTIFEAMSCESVVLVSNKSLEGKISNELIFKENNFIDLADKFKCILGSPMGDKEELGKSLRDYTLKEHSLYLLKNKICF